MAPDDLREILEIRTSDVDEMRTHSEPLYRAHWDEIAINKGVMRLSPNWVSYYELEERDRLVILTAWAADQMIGYSISIEYQHLHYSGLTVFQNDVIFVLKEWRRTGVGRSLIEETENIARERGCHMMLFHSKADTALEAIMDARGYGVQDIIHSKVL